MVEALGDCRVGRLVCARRRSALASGPSMYTSPLLPRECLGLSYSWSAAQPRAKLDGAFTQQAGRGMLFDVPQGQACVVTPRGGAAVACAHCCRFLCTPSRRASRLGCCSRWLTRVSRVWTGWQPARSPTWQWGRGPTAPCRPCRLLCRRPCRRQCRHPCRSRVRQAGA